MAASITAGACVLTAGACAFLLFQIQPILTKALLPSFGGGASVWTACLLFFQFMLLAGYGLAHAIATPAGRGDRILLLVGVGAFLMLPVTPEASFAVSQPVAAILESLTRAVSLPYLLLATGAPTLQRWYAGAGAGPAAYRLYAVSNAGALIALLSYPFIWEPHLAVSTQLEVWSLGFAVFAAAYLGLGVWIAHTGLPRRPGWRADRPMSVGLERGRPVQEQAKAPAEQDRQTPAAGVAGLPASSWVLLPAMSTALLMALTEQVSRELTVIPFLFVVPLALYLLSYTLTFAGEDFYPRMTVAVTVCVLAVPLALAAEAWRWTTTVSGVASPVVAVPGGIEAWTAVQLAFFFAATMLCHGELYRRRPEPLHLTLFYLAGSAGGALGGVAVAIVCPSVFPDYFELPLLSLATFALAAAVLTGREVPARARTVGIVARGGIAAAVALFAWAELRPLWSAASGSLAIRTFHGVHRVVRDRDARSGAAYVALYHGGVLHGLQYVDPPRRREPTSYYSHRSGAGVAIEVAQRKPSIRVGVIGLGAGTVAAYQRPRDVYRFLEIDHAVVQIARTEFDFITSSPGETHVDIGDGRLLLEASPPLSLDVLLIDAFGGDSVPAHLLTIEAFALYLRHLSPDGILGVHVSNRHLDLARVVLGAARRHGLAAARVTAEQGEEIGATASEWVLLSRDEAVVGRIPAARTAGDDTDPVVWTDQRSDLVAILR